MYPHAVSQHNPQNNLMQAQPFDDATGRRVYPLDLLVGNTHVNVGSTACMTEYAQWLREAMQNEFACMNMKKGDA